MRLIVPFGFGVYGFVIRLARAVEGEEVAVLLLEFFIRRGSRESTRFFFSRDSFRKSAGFGVRGSKCADESGQLVLV